jgi:multicomponent Na+:H+ antiporter subunit E
MTEASSRLSQYAIGFAAGMLLWVLLTGTLDGQELLAGVLVVAATTAVAGPRLAILGGVRLTPRAAVSLLTYLGYFFYALVRANLDVARRVLSPSLPIRPAVVEVRTELESRLGRLLLANSITLTPGTLSVDVRGDRILVHWIDASPGTDLESATREIAAGFERHIRGFLK